MPTFVIVQCYRCVSRSIVLLWLHSYRLAHTPPHPSLQRSCYMFLPQQETKNGKFACRFCGAKQSIVKIFGRSENAKDLRGPAQELNARHGEERDRRLEGRELLVVEEQQQAPQGRQGQFFRGRQVYEVGDDYHEDGYGHDFYPVMDEEATERAHRHQHQAAWMEAEAEAEAGAGGAGSSSRWSAYMDEEDAAATGGMMQEARAGAGAEDEVRLGLCT